MPSHVATRPGWLYFVGRSVLRPLLWVRYHPRVIGSESVPHNGPVLLVSNHLSGLDTILIPCFSPRQVRFLAKASLFATPFKNWVMRGVGAVPVQREASNEAQQALETGRDLLLSGSVFAVFPEGSRSTTGLLNKGRSGAAWLALETGATVVPIGLQGTGHHSHQSHGKQPVVIRFGAPLELDDLSDLPRGRARREATERIMRAIQELSGQAFSGEYAEGGRGA
ncbi:lysophospholipid acyltransferase family protein [Leucobacter chinensis]|uniref:lysophospholipid acyltransferase family protein n=1 Tax=Leucobacter chinensis TaxID=2851010 RepID=UPI001C23E191|nr:lysophospholipid acyltransferase family protein [Leucobacter chinensis]